MAQSLLILTTLRWSTLSTARGKEGKKEKEFNPLLAS